MGTTGVIEQHVEHVAPCRAAAIVAPPMVEGPPDLVPLAWPPVKLPVWAGLPGVVARLVA
jgi:hypothetical protein